MPKNVVDFVEAVEKGKSSDVLVAMENNLAENARDLEKRDQENGLQWRASSIMTSESKFLAWKRCKKGGKKQLGKAVTPIEANYEKDLSTYCVRSKMFPHLVKCQYL